MSILDNISSWLTKKIKDLELQEKYPMEDFKDELPENILEYKLFNLGFSADSLGEAFNNKVEDVDNSIGVIFLKEQKDKLNLITAHINKLSVENTNLKFYVFSDCKDLLNYFFNLLKWGSKSRLISLTDDQITESLSEEAFYLSGIDYLSKFKQVLTVDENHFTCNQIKLAGGNLIQSTEEAFVVNCKDCFIEE